MPEHQTPQPFANQEHTPFSEADKLTPMMPYEEMTHTHLLEWEHRPDVIVRVSPWNENWGGESMVDALEVTEKLFTELTEKYGIEVVPHRYVIGGAPDNAAMPSLYTITDRVTGDTLDTELAKPESGVSLDDLTKHFDGLIKYHADVMRLGGRYLSDVGRSNDQFMYGNTVGNRTDRLLLTDIDSIVRSYPLVDRLDREVRAMSRSLSGLAASIMRAEEVSGYDLASVRSSFVGFIDTDVVPANSEFRPRIDVLIHSVLTE